MTGVREPKYYSVKRHLLEIISAQPPGSAVPTERDLTNQLGTSRTTVRQALSDLVAEGRLVRRQGAGTFVAEPKITWPLQLTSFSEQAAAIGLQAGARLLGASRIRASEEVADRLALLPGAPVYRLKRLRLGDDLPMALETSYLSAVRFPGLLARIRRSSSLYRILTERYRVVPCDAEETIETAPATPEQAELLHTDTGAPMLVLSRHSFDSDGVPLEWVRSWYRGDRYTFVARLLEEERPATEAPVPGRVDLDQPVGMGLIQQTPHTPHTPVVPLIPPPADADLTASILGEPVLDPSGLGQPVLELDPPDGPESWLASPGEQPVPAADAPPAGLEPLTGA